MAPQPQQPPQTEGAITIEQMRRQQQTAMLIGAHMQFVTCVTMNPPPSKMPVEVRRLMWDQLTKTRALFAPQTLEEEPTYGDA